MNEKIQNQVNTSCRSEIDMKEMDNIEEISLQLPSKTETEITVMKDDDSGSHFSINKLVARYDQVSDVSISEINLPDINQHNHDVVSELSEEISPEEKHMLP